MPEPCRLAVRHNASTYKQNSRDPPGGQVPTANCGTDPTVRACAAAPLVPAVYGGSQQHIPYALPRPTVRHTHTLGTPRASRQCRRSLTAPTNGSTDSIWQVANLAPHPGTILPMFLAQHISPQLPHNNKVLTPAPCSRSLLQRCQMYEKRRHAGPSRPDTERSMQQLGDPSIQRCAQQSLEVQYDAAMPLDIASQFLAYVGVLPPRTYWQPDSCK